MTQFPAYNLEDALASEARSIAQLMLNLAYMAQGDMPFSLRPPFFGGGASRPWSNSDWPTPNEVHYEDDLGNFNLRYVHLKDIYMVKTGSIDWQEEQVHDRIVDRLLERKYNPPAGSKVTADYSVKFGAIRTREHAASLGLENEIGLRLGGINTPAGATNNTTVKAAVEDKYGQTSTFEETIADSITIEGPADLILRGERSRAQVSQVVKAVPDFEYRIVMGLRSGGPAHYYWQEAEFSSKAEFNAFIQGRASNDIGRVYQYTTRVSRSELREWALAPLARQLRQPDAVVSPHHVPLVYTTAFDDQIQQGVQWYDAATGERVDPFDYKPGVANETQD